MKEYYVNIMYRKDCGDLVQENIYFSAETKAKAKLKAKDIAKSNKARMIGFYLNN